MWYYMVLWYLPAVGSNVHWVAAAEMTEWKVRQLFLHAPSSLIDIL